MIPNLWVVLRTIVSMHSSIGIHLFVFLVLLLSMTLWIIITNVINMLLSYLLMICSVIRRWHFFKGSWLNITNVCPSCWVLNLWSSQKHSRCYLVPLISILLVVIVWDLGSHLEWLFVNRYLTDMSILDYSTTLLCIHTCISSNSFYNTSHRRMSWWWNYLFCNINMRRRRVKLLGMWMSTLVCWAVIIFSVRSLID